MVSNRRQATFVFVTPQRWNDKAKWAQQRRAERKWGDVRACDADDLVHWIELYPAVGYWLAVKIGKRPVSIRQLDEAFQEWSLATRVPMSSELVLAGRDNEAVAVLLMACSQSGAAVRLGKRGRRRRKRPEDSHNKRPAERVVTSRTVDTGYRPSLHIF
jgi:hypothetical protein